MPDLSYIDSITKDRQTRDTRMIANPCNWLSLVGLFWLEEGDNPFGKGEKNKISLSTLPSDHFGVFHLKNGQVSLKEAVSEVSLNSKPAELRLLFSDADDLPDIIEAGSISMMVIRQGEHTLLRAWDREAQAVKDFRGLKYFAVDEHYRVPTRFIPYDPPKSITIHDAIGGQREGAMLGRVLFTLNSIDCSLEVEDADDEGLISFVDQTKKKSTYPGGRYLTLPKPITEQGFLDFNQAVNWPCAYTSFATCPLPPLPNHLPIRIEAGEMRYHD
jgi:uncharacterized protein (DUF1684 family)